MKANATEPTLLQYIQEKKQRQLLKHFSADAIYKPKKNWKNKRVSKPK
jgi:hypothetical protein